MSTSSDKSYGKSDQSSLFDLPPIDFHGLSDIVDIEPTEEDKRRYEDFIQGDAK